MKVKATLSLDYQSFNAKPFDSVEAIMTTEVGID